MQDWDAFGVDDGTVSILMVEHEGIVKLYCSSFAGLIKKLICAALFQIFFSDIQILETVIH